MTEQKNEDIMDVEVDEDDIFNDAAYASTTANGDVEKEEQNGLPVPDLPEFTRKDKTLHDVLSMMEDYSPIVCLTVSSLCTLILY